MSKNYFLVIERHFSSFSISSILGNDPLKSLGSNSFNSYSDIPIGKFVVSSVYCATTSFLFLQTNNPIVGLSCGCLI